MNHYWWLFLVVISAVLGYMYGRWVRRDEVVSKGIEVYNKVLESYKDLTQSQKELIDAYKNKCDVLKNIKNNSN